MNIFYSNLYLNIEKEGQKIKLKILEQNIEIDKKNEISKKGRKQLEEWFSMLNCPLCQGHFELV